MRSSNDRFLKVCGMTRLVDALHAVQKGATAVGFIFWPDSPRAIAPSQARDIIAALPKHVTTVGVFVNEPIGSLTQAVELSGVDMVQLHGDEQPDDFGGLERPILRSVTLESVGASARLWPAGTMLLLDASDPVKRGGTGAPVDWNRAGMVARHHKFVLAGGLTPANVEEAIRTVQPAGVDVSSGVEASPGIKDFEKVSTFLANARRAFERL